MHLQSVSLHACHFKRDVTRSAFASSSKVDCVSIVFLASHSLSLSECTAWNRLSSCVHRSTEAASIVGFYTDSPRRLVNKNCHSLLLTDWQQRSPVTYVGSTRSVPVVIYSSRKNDRRASTAYVYLPGHQSITDKCTGCWPGVGPRVATRGRGGNGSCGN